MIFSAEQLTLIIAALISGVISPFTVQLAQHFFRKKREDVKSKHNLNANEALKKDEQVTAKLRGLREKYNCDRVWIAEFHNGGKTYSGKSFQRFSTTYEVVGQGVAPEAVNTQNIPTSIFSLFFKKLMEQSYYYTEDVKKTNDPMSFAMQSFWENRGVSSFVCVAIKDIESNFVGFICFDGVIHDLMLNSGEIDKLMMTASSIAGYLEA